MPECPNQPENPAPIEALYPDRNPELRYTTASALCSYGMTKLVMTGALRQVLCQHFGDPRGLLNDSLQKRLATAPWSEDPATTGIVIESLNRWRAELTEKRPTLLLKSGAWEWARVGIGDSAGSDWLTGQQHYYGHWNGSHTIFAITQEPGEAEILATEVVKIMTWYASQICSAFHLVRFVPVAIGEVAQLKESQDYYVVPVDVAYIVPEAWTLTPEAPRLKRLTFSATHLLNGQ